MAKSKPKTIRSLLDAAWKQWQDATNDIDENGAVHKTESGYRYANPAVNQRKEAAKLIADLTDLLKEEEKATTKPAGVVARKR